MEKKSRKEKAKTNEKPVSLYPLSPEEALRALLKIRAPEKQRKKRIKPTRS